MISPELTVLLIVVCSITYSLEVVFGLAGTVIMIAILNFAFPSKTLVIYSLLPQILVGSTVLLKSFGTGQFSKIELIKMLSSALAGAIVGSYLFALVPNQLFTQVLSVVIIIVGIYLVVSPSFNIHKRFRLILDLSAGISHALFGISGPIVMTRLMGTFQDKTIIRNNALLFYFGLNMIRMINYISNKMISPDIWKLYLYSAPVLIPVLFFAEKLHSRISDIKFKKIVAWLILVSGVIYFIR